MTTMTATTTCPSCRYENPSGAAMCSQCRTRLGSATLGADPAALGTLGRLKAWALSYRTGDCPFCGAPLATFSYDASTYIRDVGSVKTKRRAYSMSCGKCGASWFPTMSSCLWAAAVLTAPIIVAMPLIVVNLELGLIVAGVGLGLGMLAIIILLAYMRLAGRALFILAVLIGLAAAVATGQGAYVWVGGGVGFALYIPFILLGKDGP